ncbi:tetratricopeptide repeat protein [Oryzifoliimicrobium ureilyticus]|uniref:tetratricopeptide repeat protein n=1 Tax=Oryzifoliimicrobium ureilyticus TaxID=3113724 RepID=UPI00307679CE
MTDFLGRVRGGIRKIFGGKADPRGDERPAYSPALEKAAQEGDLTAIMAIAGAYEEGRGVKPDRARALFYWQKAASYGEFESRLKVLSLKGYTLADFYNDKTIRGPLTLPAFAYSEEAEKAAKGGNADAMAHVGVSYLLGLGVPIDEQRGSDYLNKASQLGHAGAQFMLALIEHARYSKESNIGSALYWATLSMLNGSAISRDFYQELASMATDYDRWAYTVLLCTDHPKLLDNKELALMPREIAFGYSEKIEEMARAGKINSMVHIGISYTFGYGVEQDRERGLYWWRAARDRGHAGAQYLILAEAEKVIEEENKHREPAPEKDYTYSHELQAAADAGDAQAMVDIATSFHEGLGVEQNPDLALKYWRAAAYKHHPAGQFWLGVSYDIGKAIPQDRIEALYWSFLSHLQSHQGGSIYYSHMFNKVTPEEYQKFAALFEQRQSHLVHLLREDTEARRRVG